MTKLFTTLLLAAGLSACATAPQPKPLADALGANPQLSTFNRLVDQAGLRDSLRGEGPLTVFAPSDQAFQQLPAKTLESLSANPAQLKAVLSYHMLPAKVAAADVRNGNAKTVEGSNLALARAGEFVTVEEAMVQQADLVATNGVVHVIDRVLMPPKK